jgi:type II secretory pathway pseudopilin PulG
MKLKELFNSKSGQTLVEVVVVLGIVVLLCTGLISGTIFSLKANQSSRARSIAVKFVQEGIEIARKDKESGWYAFKSLTSGTSNYCVNSGLTTFLPASPLTPVVDPAVTCNANIIQGSPAISFTRYATFKLNNSPESMTVTVTVNWNDGATVRTSQATTDFTKWR